MQNDLQQKNSSQNNFYEEFIKLRIGQIFLNLFLLCVCLS